MSERIQAMNLVVKMAETYLKVCPGGTVQPDADDFITAREQMHSALVHAGVMIKEAEAADADPWGKVKLALEAIDDTHQPIESILAISTSHISQLTSGRLGGGDINAVLVYDHKGYGWMVHVPSDPEAWGEIATANTEGEVPDDLFNCMLYARNLGCCWLLLDADAAEIEDLKPYEWT